MPGLILPDNVTLWTPSQAIQGDFSVSDAAFTQVPGGAVPCYLEPMTPHERQSMFGDLDIRTCHVWLPVSYAQGASALLQKTLLYDIDRDMAWLLMAAMDAYVTGTPTDHAAGVARHQVVFPDYIKEGTI